MWQFYLVGAEQSFLGAGMVNFPGPVGEAA
jgi:hypothetical protein